MDNPDSDPGEDVGEPGSAVGLPEIAHAEVFMIMEVVILWIILFFLVIQVAAIYPVLLLPVAPLAWWANKQKMLVHRSLPCATFAFGFIPGMVLIWFSETILFAIWRFIFSVGGVNTDPTTLEEEKDAGYVMFWLFVSFFVFALATEVGKYLVLKYAKVVFAGALEKNGMMLMTVAGALGFSISNNVVILLVRVIVEGWDIPLTLGWGVYLTVVLDTLHCLTAYYIAIQVVRQEILSHNINIFDILAVPIIARGLLVFVSTPIPAFLNTAAMWTVIVIVDIVIVGGMLACIKFAQTKLPREHIERGGYFGILGGYSEPPTPVAELDLQSDENAVVRGDVEENI
eukprot:CAMPEP_0197529188 /NCGR_PEP_ID=MMETSP1318-20131121/27561_1 /TAXON_ID=552666 /ORGANISM="Partenskyella glossopodia, Strain RCC365" /LENGTH=342 /DNA_ID=CAMNT_0043084565 /DNA_START=89 /DNA_END=1117 /DNA_ORIENTATION=+